ncbi:hypothetical protein VIGAN_11113800 [Vigna angularis var. angularis]|uniref:Uncharacterized protein n=1 Tax=Vigna angularis var. angularis TaxID=157739 RepID=A0A0S3T9C3_PHAAN|nr:hypothetical protein VIGAN_11113800 [Vigna angularis var. angularis]
MEGTKLEAVTASGTTVKALSHLEVRMRRCHNWIWLMGTALESVIVGRSSWSCDLLLSFSSSIFSLAQISKPPLRYSAAPPLRCFVVATPLLHRRHLSFNAAAPFSMSKVMAASHPATPTRDAISDLTPPPDAILDLTPPPSAARASGGAAGLAPGPAPFRSSPLLVPVVVITKRLCCTREFHSSVTSPLLVQVWGLRDCWRRFADFATVGGGLGLLVIRFGG